MLASSPLILVIGGARSGKSRYAQQLAASFGEAVTYVATAMLIDAEMQARIARHRAERPKTWRTLEAPHSLTEALADGASDQPSAFLIDCLTLWLSNRLMEGLPHDETVILEGKESETEQRLLGEVEDLLKTVRAINIPTIIVSNEVGLGIVPMRPIGRLFRDIQGWANQRIATEADAVYWTVAGIPMKVK